MRERPEQTNRKNLEGRKEINARNCKKQNKTQKHIQTKTKQNKTPQTYKKRMPGRKKGHIRKQGRALGNEK